MSYATAMRTVPNEANMHPGAVEHLRDAEWRGYGHHGSLTLFEALCGGTRYRQVYEMDERAVSIVIRLGIEVYDEQQQRWKSVHGWFHRSCEG